VDQAAKIKADVATFTSKVEAYKSKLHERAFYAYATGPEAAYPALQVATDELGKLSKVRGGGGG
jgi:hypothetical protein